MASGLRLGKYTLLRKLATGGMAEVFLARAEGPGGPPRPVVVKRILPTFAADQAFLGMFLNEARVASQLHHPNLVRIHELGQTQGTYFLVMEHIDGPNLRQLCRRPADGLLRLEQAVGIVSQACAGLQHAHDLCGADGRPLGLVHRDVSPDNLLLSRQGVVKVVDFGIAKAVNQAHLTKTGVLKGKLAYMSPEQVGGLPVDRRSDVFALGVVLHELLAGARPFDGPSEMAIMEAIRKGAPASLRAARPDVDRPLEQILEQALCKDPAQRYPSCQALQADLERYLAARGVACGARELAALVEERLGPPPPSELGAPSPGPDMELVLSPVSLTAPTSPVQGAAPLVLVREATPSGASRGVPRWAQLGGAVAAVLAVGVGAYNLGHRSVLSEAPVAQPVPPAPAQPPEQPAPKPAPTPSTPVRVAVSPDAPTPSPVEPAPHLAPGPRRPRPPPPAKAVAAPRAAEPTVSARTGTLAFRVLPWANVEIDGRAYGLTPIADVSLAPGHHRVVLVNAELPARRELEVEVEEGRTAVVKVRLDE